MKNILRMKADNLTIISSILLIGAFFLLNPMILPKNVNAQYPYPPPSGTGGGTEIIYSHRLFIPMTYKPITPPEHSRSYYVWYIGGLYNLGCTN